MTKTLCSILVGALAATLLVATASPSSAAVTTEGFGAAVPTGWTAKNNSDPVGFRSVFQGDPTVFSAHDGPSTSYAAMNYGSVSGAHATISTWLITPKYTSLSNGDAWSFFTRTEDVQSGWIYPDRLEVRLSTNGGCSPGTGASAVGDFTTLLTTINPALVAGGYPVAWTQFQGALTGITGGVKAGCLAFRYYVAYAGSQELNGDYIGIDTYSFDDQPADTTPPDTTITSGPDGITTDATPTFAFTSTEAGSTFACSVDGAAYDACSGPGASHTTATLSEGAHTFAVRATDDMLNPDPTPATRTFTVDAAAPNTTITSGPGGPTNDSTPTFAFISTEAGSTFACAVDDAAYAACSEPDGSHTTSTLSEGAHTFAVRATDPAGHVEDAPETTSFTVDTVDPDTSITSGPDGLTNDPTPTFGIASAEEGSTFECSVDQAEFSSCPGPELTLPTLSDDDHVVAVRAVDAAGNVDPTPAVRELTVDTTTPETTIETAPPAFTHDPTPAFGFTAGDGVSTYECALDDAEFVACAGADGAYTAPLLDDGSHTLAVRATDPAGNVDASPAQVGFTVDTAAPDTSITAGPTGDTQSTRPTFTFTSDETGSTYECALDGAEFVACSGPSASHTTALTDGAHSFTVRATDPAGNTDPNPAQVDFTVDTAAPDTSITAGPAGDTQSTRPTFTFTSTETGSTYECSLDGAPYDACSGPGPTHTTAALTVGAHTFVVRATDRAGNEDPLPAIRSFTVVSPPPSCAVDKASVTKAKAAVTKATTALTKATKRLKAAKKAGKPKAIARGKKDVTAASKKVKTAKRTLAVATGRLIACQAG